MAISNNFEGGTDGVDFIQGVGGNTGGASGDFIDVVSKNVEVSAVCEFSNVQSKNTMAARLKSGVTSQVCAFYWTTQLPDSSDEYGRFYFYMEDRPTAQHWWTQFLTSGSVLQGGMQLATSGAIQIYDSIGATNSLGSYQMLADQWYRIEYRFQVGVNFEVRVYLDDSTSTSDVINRSLAGSTAIGESRYGVLSAFASIPTTGSHYYYDDMVAGATNWPGPSTVTSADRPIRTVRSAMRW